VIRVMANGCFDLLHPGHIAHLRAARDLGDYLIVSLTLDEYVGKGPGRPIYIWKDRAEVLRELRCVDVVVPTKNAVDAIRLWRPDIFVKGVDYLNGGWTEDVISACKEVGAELMFTTTPKRSASDAIRKVIALDGGKEK
jgi:rfaE bifunctional protein nucleotidyltransferase chain/domain